MAQIPPGDKKMQQRLVDGLKQKIDNDAADALTYGLAGRNLGGNEINQQQYNVFPDAMTTQKLIEARQRLNEINQQQYNQQYQNQQMAEFERERAHRQRSMARFDITPKEPRMTSSADRTRQRILSRPIPVRWQGWESNTTSLQRAGWQLAVEYDISRDNYTLMMRHKEMNLTAITSAVHLDQSISRLDRFQNQGFGSPSPGINAIAPFNVIHVAPTITNVRVDTNASWKDFKLIDAEPRLVDSEIERIEDLNIFALAIGEAEQISIDQADMTVVEHLEAIKDLQSDKQKELREKARRNTPQRDGEMVTGEVVVQLVNYQ